MEFPDTLRYTKEHEWIRLEDDGATVTIGITAFAQSELGDIIFVEVETVGESLANGEVFGTVEASRPPSRSTSNCFSTPTSVQATSTRSFSKRSSYNQSKRELRKRERETDRGAEK